MKPNPRPPWKPRGSQLGSYLSCMYRAAFERALHEMIVELTPEDAQVIEQARKSSPYADLGTCIHYHTQDGVRARFWDGKPEHHKPKAEQITNAASLFNGSTERLSAQIRNAAVLAATHLQGEQWVAEREVITSWVTGHIDFLSEDGTTLIDLKTTAKPPLGGVIKPAHMVQVLAYAEAIGEIDGHQPSVIKVLYVDSINASWAQVLEIDNTAPAINEYRKQIRDYANFLMSPHLFQAASPQIGHACEEWCPFVTMCRNKITDAVTSGAKTAPKPLTTRNPLS